MCGRYAITLPPEAVRAFFSYVEQPNFPPRYNVAPSQPIPIVLHEARTAPSERHFRLVRWGFVPSFVKNLRGFRPIVNARSEEIWTKPSFRNAFRRRRCLVIADGFYEWQATAKPFLVRRADGLPFGLAGIHETWLGADGSEIDTACILTRDAVGTLRGVHHRMPVMVDAADFEAWLENDETRLDDVLPILGRLPTAGLDVVALSPAVNKVANDDAAVQAPLEGAMAERVSWTSRLSDGGQPSLF